MGTQKAGDFNYKGRVSSYSYSGAWLPKDRRGGLWATGSCALGLVTLPPGLSDLRGVTEQESKG